MNTFEIGKFLKLKFKYLTIGNYSFTVQTEVLYKHYTYLYIIQNDPPGCTYSDIL